LSQIICHIEKCLACCSCELACAVEHSQSKILKKSIQETPIPKKRIQVELIDDQGLSARQRVIALQCRHCEDPQCVEACISGGIYKDEETGAILVKKEKCVACWSCIMICPFGAITQGEDNKIAVKCDFCRDREIPACIEACPTKALVICEQCNTELEFTDTTKP
jgi:carbon-monoxide dehydrogenase iron sulfur subunit